MTMAESQTRYIIAYYLHMASGKDFGFKEMCTSEGRMGGGKYRGAMQMLLYHTHTHTTEKK